MDSNHYKDSCGVLPSHSATMPYFSKEQNYILYQNKGSKYWPLNRILQLVNGIVFQDFYKFIGHNYSAFMI